MTASDFVMSYYTGCYYWKIEIELIEIGALYANYGRVCGIGLCTI